VKHVAWIGVGANLGEAAATVVAAIDLLGQNQAIEVDARSSLYASAPRDHVDQPDFVNAVARLRTTLSASRLLTVLHGVEDRFGRDRAGVRYGPRTADLDLLLYDDLVQDDPALTLPHPRMHRRGFVLRPMADIDPDATVPGHGPVSTLLAACADQRVEPLAQE
jgi:2-amino-4-hydroxy-6-hydroxymethyldihydropteridine diphosphokinase